MDSTAPSWRARNGVRLITVATLALNASCTTPRLASAVIPQPAPAAVSYQVVASCYATYVELASVSTYPALKGRADKYLSEATRGNDDIQIFVKLS